MNNKHNLALVDETALQDGTDPQGNTSPVTRPDKQASSWHAFLTLGLAKTARGTVLKTCDHQGPLYVQKPFYPEGPAVAHIYLLHPPGGMVSGDRLTITAHLAENTHTLITTPGAGRAYRAREDKTLQHQIIELNVAHNSTMEWLPQETILYPNAHVRLENRINLTGSATFIGWEITCFGLPANQETFEAGHAEQGLQIYQNGRLKVRERLVIDDQSRKIFTAKAGLDNKPVNGLMIAGPFDQKHNYDELIDALRGLCQAHPALSGATLVDDFIMVRCIHHDSEQVKQLFTQCWHLLRPALINKEACEPRIWAT